GRDDRRRAREEGASGGRREAEDALRQRAELRRAKAPRRSGDRAPRCLAATWLGRGGRWRPVLFALVVAALVAALSGSIVLLAQGLLARKAIKDDARRRQATEFARKTGGVVTPLSVAKELNLSPLDADRLLRSMVDDVHLTMDIDVHQGELRFWFTQLVADPVKEAARPRRRTSAQSRRGREGS